MYSTKVGDKPSSVTSSLALHKNRRPIRQSKPMNTHERHAHTHARTHAHAHTRTHMHTHTHMNTLKHMNTRTHTHTRTHAYTHNTHTHAQKYINFKSSPTHLSPKQPYIALNSKIRAR